ncbi:hypothetical protein C2R22_02450 [Salinigranum rubrum]|uniref:Uncharacterized protein n=1 Tax=Salinigranum rubrum TaxID=755307 RepID=A0A2I8VFG5_9EURY|nr:hypothetical protein [Salinigranum rubrum]AUV80655.1 hypothetical protein C2R22_02450 [Salinigranum rubrum]
MPGDDTRAFSGGSGSSSSWSGSISAGDFVGGTSVRWGALATTITGGFFLIATLGATALVNAVSAAYVALFGGVAGFVSDVLESLAAIPIQAADAAWNAALTFLYGFGVGSPLLGVLIGLVALYVLMEALYG